MAENENNRELGSEVIEWFDSLLTELGQGKKLNIDDEEDRKRIEYYEIEYGFLRSKKVHVGFDELFSPVTHVRNSAIKSLYEEAAAENLYIYNKTDKTLRRATIGYDGKIILSDDIGNMLPPKKPGWGPFMWFASDSEKKKYEHDVKLYEKEENYFATLRNKPYGDIMYKRDMAVIRSRSKEYKQLQKIEEKEKKLEEKKKKLLESSNIEAEDKEKGTLSQKEQDVLLDIIEKFSKKAEENNDTSLKNAEKQDELKLAAEKQDERKKTVEKNGQKESENKNEDLKKNEADKEKIDSSKKVNDTKISLNAYQENIDSKADTKEKERDIDKNSGVSVNFKLILSEEEIKEISECRLNPEGFVKSAVGSEKIDRLTVNKLINSINDKNFVIGNKLTNSKEMQNNFPTGEKLEEAVNKLFSIANSQTGLSKETVYAGAFASVILSSYTNESGAAEKLSEKTAEKLMGIREMGKIASAGFEARDRINRAVDMNTLEDREKLIKDYMTFSLADYSLRLQNKLNKDNNSQKASGIMSMLCGKTDAEKFSEYVAGREAVKALSGSTAEFEKFKKANNSEKLIFVEKAYKETINNIKQKAEYKTSVKEKSRENIKMPENKSKEKQIS